MNNRKRMYDSNKRARTYLLEVEGCTDVWFKRHTRRKDKTYTQYGFYSATDLFNLFDGVALNKDVILFQVKTNRWPAPRPLLDFSAKFPAVVIMALNVRKKNGKMETAKRIY